MSHLTGQQIFFEGVRLHWVSVLFLLITLLTIIVIAVFRWWWKRRYRRLIEETLDWGSEFDLLPPLGSKDQEALELIKGYRQSMWAVPDTELDLSIEALSERAMHVVRSVAAVYYPDNLVPEYETSLVESLQLIRRVTGRLIRLATITPFKFLGNRKLSEYQRFYQVYRKINENPLLQVLKRHKHLYKVARWALNVKNISNPFYWAGREISREGYFFMLRWFYMALVSQVGREAMRLYSGRHFQKEEDRDATLICYRLFALAGQWDGPSREEWAVLVDFVTNHPALEPEIKLHILTRWSQRRLPKDVHEQPLQTDAGAKWYRDGLKLLLKTLPEDVPLKKQRIHEELESLSTVSEAPNGKGELLGPET